MTARIFNGSEFLNHIESDHSTKVPLSIRNDIITELDHRHQRYLDLVGLFTLISRLDDTIILDLVNNLIQSSNQRSR